MKRLVSDTQGQPRLHPANCPAAQSFTRRLRTLNGFTACDDRLQTPDIRTGSSHHGPDPKDSASEHRRAPRAACTSGPTTWLQNGTQLWVNRKGSASLCLNGCKTAFAFLASVRTSP